MGGYAVAVAVDYFENVYVTGSSYVHGRADDYATIKYSSSGTLLWIKSYNGSGNNSDVPTCIVVDDSGNVYVSGYSYGSGTGSDFATIKYNTNGVQEWVQRYNGPVGNAGDGASAIVLDNSHNILVTGRSMGIRTGYDYVTIKYSPSGIQQWVQRYNGSLKSTDEPTSIAVDNTGNVYITGYSFGINTNSDYATIKYDANGIQQWVRRYNGPVNGMDDASSVIVDNSGNTFVTGYSMGLGSKADYVTIKYNINGEQLWVQRYDGSGNDWDVAYSIAIDGSGNVYITGESYADSSGSDYVTIKYDSNGVQEWVQRYSGPGNDWDQPLSIVIDRFANVYVTGRSTGIGTGTDFATVKYSQDIGIKLGSKEIPDRFSLFQNYPNPFNPSTKIKFLIPLNKGGGFSRGMFTKLTIYDLLGQEITTLVNEQLHPGTYEVDWDGTNYPSGVYFYEMTASNYKLTRKMVLLK
jgi:hypothetical protein